MEGKSSTASQVNPGLVDIEHVEASVEMSESPGHTRTSSSKSSGSLLTIKSQVRQRCRTAGAGGQNTKR